MPNSECRRNPSQSASTIATPRLHGFVAAEGFVLGLGAGNSMHLIDGPNAHVVTTGNKQAGSFWKPNYLSCCLASGRECLISVPMSGGSALAFWGFLSLLALERIDVDKLHRIAAQMKCIRPEFCVRLAIEAFNRERISFRVCSPHRIGFGDAWVGHGPHYRATPRSGLWAIQEQTISTETLADIETAPLARALISLDAFEHRRQPCAAGEPTTKVDHVQTADFLRFPAHMWAMASQMASSFRLAALRSQCLIFEKNNSMVQSGEYLGKENSFASAWRMASLRLFPCKS
jgi:hypothetical protein